MYIIFVVMKSPSEFVQYVIVQEATDSVGYVVSISCDASDECFIACLWSTAECRRCIDNRDGS